MEMVLESELFQALSKKLGPKETKLLIKWVTNISKEESKNQPTQKDLLQVKIEIMEKVQRSHNSLLAWVIVLWLSTLGVIITLALTLFK